jgi:hypothetical protein
MFDDLDPILDFALPLYDLGFSISPPIPVHGKFPHLPWKPYQTVRASKRELIDWAFDYPCANYGIITGKLSGVVCLDTDNGEAESVISEHCPPTPMQQVSGSKRGRHHIYRHPGIHVPTRKNMIVHGGEVKGLDLRGDGGLFIGPGSLHRLTGYPYMMIEPWTKEMLSAVPVFDFGWLGLKAEPPKSRNDDAGPARGDIPLNRKQELAREFLEGKDGSKAGEGKAEGYCFALASGLVHGYDLSPGEAEELLLEWGERESNTDAHGSYYPWKRSEIRHKLEDAANQGEPQGRPRGYLLPAWDQEAVEAIFNKQRAIKLFKAPVGCAELEPVLRGPDDTVVPTHLPVESSVPAPNLEPQSLPPALDPDDPVRRFADDPRTAYLWKGSHANDTNVRPSERLARSKSVLEAFAMIPKTGLMADFLATYLPNTDCSCTLLLGAGLGLCASLLNRRVWINQGTNRLHPHLWCGLVAASGERK